MSRATASGDKVSLSGDEPFRDLVLPLVKALRHARTLFTPEHSLRPHLLLCVAVLDAPMVLIEDPQKADDPLLCPWIRVIRREPNPDRYSWTRSRFYALDIVHAGFLSTFVTSHVLPFGEFFAERIRERGWIMKGTGIVESLDNWSWEQILKA